MRYFLPVAAFVVLIVIGARLLTDFDAPQAFVPGGDETAMDGAPEPAGTIASRRFVAPPPPDSETDPADTLRAAPLRVFAEDGREITRAGLRFRDRHARGLGTPLFFSNDMVSPEFLGSAMTAQGENIVPGDVLVATNGVARLRGRITGRIVLDGAPIDRMVRLGVLRPRSPDAKTAPVSYGEMYSAADGTFRLDNVPLGFVARLDCDEEFRPAGDEAVVIEGPADDLVVNLVTRPRLTATFEYDDGMPAASVNVSLDSRYRVFRTDARGTVSMTVPESGRATLSIDGETVWRSPEPIEHDLDVGVIRLKGVREVLVHVGNSEGVPLADGFVRSGGRNHQRVGGRAAIRARIALGAATVAACAPGHRSVEIVLDDRREYFATLDRAVSFVVQAWTPDGITINLPVLVRSEEPLPPLLDCLFREDHHTAVFAPKMGRTRIAGFSSADRVTAVPVSDVEFLQPVATRRRLTRSAAEGPERFDVSVHGVHNLRSVVVECRHSRREDFAGRISIGPAGLPRRPLSGSGREVRFRIPAAVRTLGVRVEEIVDGEWKALHDADHGLTRDRVEIVIP